MNRKNARIMKHPEKKPARNKVSRMKTLRAIAKAQSAIRKRIYKPMMTKMKRGKIQNAAVILNRVAPTILTRRIERR